MKSKIAITGGIGSGKSTIAKMVQVMGYPVFYTDPQASYIIEHDNNVIDQMCTLFGSDIYQNGKLNRPRLAQIIFNNNKAKEAVNGIVHPAVWERFTAWSNAQTSPIVFMESAILHECGWAERFDKVICVTAHLETRITRTIERDKSSRENVIARIKNQMSDEEKCKASHFVIHTDEEFSEIEQLLSILGKIL